MKRILRRSSSCWAPAPAGPALPPGRSARVPVSYRAKMFPNTEVGAVSVATTQEGSGDTRSATRWWQGRTLPTYAGSTTSTTPTPCGSTPRRCVPSASRATSASRTTPSAAPNDYRWATRWSTPAGAARKRPEQQRTMRLTDETMDAIVSSSACAHQEPTQSARASPRRCAWCSRHDPRPAVPLPGARAEEDPQHGAVRHPQVRVPAGHHRGILVHRRHRLTIWISTTATRSPSGSSRPCAWEASTPTYRGYRGLRPDGEPHE